MKKVFLLLEANIWMLGVLSPFLIFFFKIVFLDSLYFYRTLTQPPRIFYRKPRFCLEYWINDSLFTEIEKSETQLDGNREQNILLLMFKI